MKIIHAADLHIDSKMQTNLSKEKANERKKEILLSFERMVDFASENNVEIIIIAGDMFDTSKISIATKNRIFNIMKSHGDIKFVYLAGNHDEQNVIDSFSADLDNLFIIGDNWTTYTFGNIDITGAKVEGKSQTIYDSLLLDKDKFNIVVLHGQISKYNLKSEQLINLTKLRSKNIDYLALGHIHSFEEGKLDDRGVYAYSGCLEGRGFDECGNKGFVLLDIENGKFKHEFIQFAKRTLHEVEIDITDRSDWFDIENVTMRATDGIPENDLVKVTLVGKYSLELSKQIEHLQTKLNGKFYYAKIKDESVMKVDQKDYEYDVSLRGEFIRQVLASDLSDKEKEDIILVGTKALDGEDL